MPKTVVFISIVRLYYWICQLRVIDGLVYFFLEQHTEWSTLFFFSWNTGSKSKRSLSLNNMDPDRSVKSAGEEPDYSFEEFDNIEEDDGDDGAGDNGDADGDGDGECQF